MKCVTDLKPIIVALDFDRAEAALEFAGLLTPERCRLKVGLELYTRAGGDLIRSLHDRGFDIFLDLKFHDIPNTVAAACRQAASLGVWMLNVHALGGLRMMQAAREAVNLEVELSRQLYVPPLRGRASTTSV